MKEIYKLYKLARENITVFLLIIIIALQMQVLLALMV